MRPIDADSLRRVFASGVRVYDGMCKMDDVIHNIDNAPTIDADDYFDAVDRIKPCPNCRYMHIHKILSENGNAPWISVEERTPEANEMDENGYFIAYLVAEHNGLRMKTAIWDGKHWFLVGAGKTLDNVTHWMPLPMGPEEVQHD